MSVSFYIVCQMAPFKPRARRGAAVVILLLAAATLSVAWYFQTKAQHKITTWRHAEGIVNRVEKVWTSDPQNNTTQLTYIPHIHFVAADGLTYEHTASIQSNVQLYEVGEKIELLYPPDKPHEAMENNMWGLYFLPILFSSIGVLFVVCGGVCFLPELFPHRFRDPYIVYLEEKRKKQRQKNS